jgi:hypothetical protein
MKTKYTCNGCASLQCEVRAECPAILLKYYVTLETEQRAKAEQQAQERMKALGLYVAPALEVTA